MGWGIVVPDWDLQLVVPLWQGSGERALRKARHVWLRFGTHHPLICRFACQTAILGAPVWGRPSGATSRPGNTLEQAQGVLAAVSMTGTMDRRSPKSSRGMLLLDLMGVEEGA